MKTTNLVWFNSQDERMRLLATLYEKGYRHPDYFDPMKQSTYHTLNIDPVSRWIGPVTTLIGASAVSSGVRFYTVDEMLLLFEEGFERELPKILFHVPHDGREFPENLMDSVVIPKEQFLKYHEIMWDSGVAELVPKPFHFYRTMISFPVSRLLCDVERFTGPEEMMEKYGMGFCYEKAYDGTVIKRITEKVRNDTLSYYWEHHRRLDKETQWRTDQTLLIDLHSFSEEIVPKDFLTGEPVPDICIGTDPVYTPEHLTESAKRLFSRAGYSVSENYPYKGCMVPNAVISGQSSCRFSGIMIELNKRVYLSRKGGVREKKAEQIREILKKLVLEYDRAAVSSGQNPDSSLA